MVTKYAIYNNLPESIKPIIKRGYYKLTNHKTDEQLHSEFVNNFFPSRAVYKTYTNEFEQGPAIQTKKEAIRKFQKLTGENTLYGININIARDYYAVIRHLEPSVVVETGVCNGISTLAILLAIQKNESGKLYSIDYPLRANESLEEFRRETFDQYGGAIIPHDKEPGWIIPDSLKHNWELILGKSQRELPRLIIELDNLDLFIHDSEHSHPCMMFEFELAFEWLTENGVILSDDISWNSAFSTFTNIRDLKNGYLSNNAGYIKKTSSSKDS
jgi:predicted O-methyltransferase YrrM